MRTLWIVWCILWAIAWASVGWLLFPINLGMFVISIVLLFVPVGRR